MTTVWFWNTQFQWVRPSMRTVVSSEQMMRERRNRARIAASSLSKQGLARRHGIQRAFADLQGKQVPKQPAQPLIADRMREAQIDRQRQDVHAEWRTRLQARILLADDGGLHPVDAVPG